MAVQIQDGLKCSQCGKIATIPEASQKRWFIVGRLGQAEPEVCCSSMCARSAVSQLSKPLKEPMGEWVKEVLDRPDESPV